MQARHSICKQATIIMSRINTKANNPVQAYRRITRVKNLKVILTYLFPPNIIKFIIFVRSMITRNQFN